MERLKALLHSTARATGADRERVRPRSEAGDRARSAGSGPARVRPLAFSRRAADRVIDADAIGHEVLTTARDRGQVVDRWGESVQKPDGSLDRREIGRIVFTNPTERKALEGLVFPYIGQRCREEIQRGMADASTAFVVLRCRCDARSGME